MLDRCERSRNGRVSDEVTSALQLSRRSIE
jgi:hypothetical protein